MIARLYHGFPPPPERGQRRMKTFLCENDETFAVLKLTIVQSWKRRIPANDRDDKRW